MIVCIIIAAALIAAIYINGKDRSCDQCEVHFKTTRSYGQALAEPIDITEKANDLYEWFLEGECLIKLDKNRGYYK